MHGSSIVSSMKSCQDTRSLSARRSTLVGSPSTFTFATSSFASTRSLVTPNLQGGSYWCLNIILKTRNTPHKYSVKCTPENGGGQSRYVHISIELYCVLRPLLAIPRSTQSRRHNHSCHHFFGQDATHPFYIQKCIPC